ncbi:hypothetical protein TCAL_11948 [Tigriopus californicus]|uniref:G-protein coupled receptors family 1 profile domain-containing protein n=1 Tax=Tigriopus californicus TaxID=6832 RepID=A0A553PN94_TIGCA|nr:hypothetical protein TCAL_11948 [Tigriopus californicus]
MGIMRVCSLSVFPGNVFVIAAIILERNLQNVANYLILSLAVADLLVAVLVMPLGAVYEISKEWTFGTQLCDIWTMSDVLCCTASILHLLAIAVDRYWAVTQVHYIHSRTIRTVSGMIAAIWFTSVFVSLAPMFGWKDNNFETRVNVEKTCMVSQDVSYQVFATMATFYVPLVVILLLYWRIFLTARNRLRTRQAQKAQVPHSVRKSNPLAGAKAHRNGSHASEAKMSAKNRVKTVLIRRSKPKMEIPLEQAEEAEETAFQTLPGSRTRLYSDGAIHHQPMGPLDDSPTSRGEHSPSCPKNSPTNSVMSQGCQTERSAARPLGLGKGAADQGKRASKRQKAKRNSSLIRHQKEKKHVSLEAKRERKAAKTLAIVTGAFIVCWLPFFILALLMPIFKSHEFDGRLVSFFLWLGYFNSTLNPIIYTVFSPEFRQAFQRLLFGKATNQSHRPRHLQ